MPKAELKPNYLFIKDFFGFQVQRSVLEVSKSETGVVKGDNEVNLFIQKYDHPLEFAMPGKQY